MATEFFYFKGKTKWFRPVTPNKFGKWSHQLYLDAPSLEKVRELQAEGVKNVIKKDDDGYYINLSRPIEMKSNTPGGLKMQGLPPPRVVDKDNNPLDGIMIGNGSDVTSKVAVYQHKVPNSDKKAKAMRWDSSRVDNLIPFKQAEDFPTEEAKQIAGLKDQPAQEALW